jgi:ParB family transcriptional regulator, chromosome partitioning protein
MQTAFLPLIALIPDPAQPRKSMPADELSRLAASIAARGLLMPLRVKPADADGQHVIVSGHRRHAAMVKLGWTQAECIVVDGPLDETTILGEQLAENIHREDLSPIEEAEAYRRYLSLTKFSAAQAAKELHVPASRISRALPLLDLPEEVRVKIQIGQIHKETGYYLSRLPEGEERARLLRQAIEGTLTRDNAARAVKSARSIPSDVASVSRVTCKLVGGRSLTVSAPSITLDSLIATLEDVLKEARKARPQGWDVSTLAKVFRDRAALGGAA